MTDGERGALHWERCDTRVLPHLPSRADSRAAIDDAPSDLELTFGQRLDARVTSGRGPRAPMDALTELTQLAFGGIPESHRAALIEIVRRPLGDEARSR